MSIEHRTDLIPSPPIQTKIYPLLIASGFAIVTAALIIAIVLAGVASDVFDNTKELRDAALAGSPLLADQGDLATIPLWVQPFTFVGLTLLIGGIFTVFWGLLQSLQEARGAAMVEAVPILVQGTSTRNTEGS